MARVGLAPAHGPALTDSVLDTGTGVAYVWSLRATAPSSTSPVYRYMR